MKSILTLALLLLPLLFSCKNADDVFEEYNAYFDIIPQTHEAVPGDPDFDARSMLLSTYDVRTDSSLSIPAPTADSYHWTFCSLAKDGKETTLREWTEKNLILDASTLSLKVDTYTHAHARDNGKRDGLFCEMFSGRLRSEKNARRI